MAGRRRSAFTLIEVTVVLFLITLFLGMSMTSLKGFLPASAVESAARELVMVLDSARVHAIGSGQPYEVVFDLDEQRYAIRTPFDEEGNLVADPEERKLLSWHTVSDGVVLEEVLDASGQPLASGRYVLTFHPAGDARDFWAGFGHEAGEGYRMTVRVLGLTGIATVFEGEVLPQELREADFG